MKNNFFLLVALLLVAEILPARSDIDIARISVAGASDSDEVRTVLRSYEHISLSQTTVEQIISALLLHYEEQGYPLAAIRVSSIDVDTSLTALVKLEIEEGEKLAVDEVRVKGNETTLPYVITRELGIRRGEVFREDRAERARQRLVRLGYFDRIDDPELYRSQGGIGIIIGVHEGRMNTFNGVVGYQPPPSPGAKSTVTGLVDISLRNLFGSGRDARVLWHSETQSKDLSFRYREPWLFDLPLHARVAITQRDETSLYTFLSLALNLDLTFFEQLTGTLGVQREVTTPSEGALAFDARSTLVNAELAFDSRDDAYAPHHGGYYHTGVEYGKKVILGPEALVKNIVNRSPVLERISFDAFVAQDIFKNTVLTGSLHGKTFESDIIDVADLYRLGGAQSVRGYREAQFRATSYGWVSLEPRFFIAERSFLYPFIDVGYFIRDEHSGSIVKQSLFGYGVGVQLETSVGFIRTSVANSRGEDFSQAKLHLEFLGQF